jgi:hypothetical protein
MKYRNLHQLDRANIIVGACIRQWHDTAMPDAEIISRMFSEKGQLSVAWLVQSIWASSGIAFARSSALELTSLFRRSQILPQT